MRVRSSLCWRWGCRRTSLGKPVWNAAAAVAAAAAKAAAHMCGADAVTSFLPVPVAAPKQPDMALQNSATDEQSSPERLALPTSTPGAAKSELPATTKIIVSSHDYEKTASDEELRALVEVRGSCRRDGTKRRKPGCL